MLRRGSLEFEINRRSEFQEAFSGRAPEPGRRHCPKKT